LKRTPSDCPFQQVSLPLVQPSLARLSFVPLPFVLVPFVLVPFVLVPQVYPLADV
jgi:hypothetical protein